MRQSDKVNERIQYQTNKVLFIFFGTINIDVILS
jgi:hypothetical protein